MNPFDALKKTVFDTVTNTMGTNALVNQSDTIAEMNGRVLFNRPTSETEMAGAGFNPLHYRMEYRDGIFPGLFESVREGNIETVTINGKTYNILDGYADYDGESYRLALELQP